MEPNELSLEYKRITESGFAWINLSCYGIYYNRLVIVLEFPANANNSANTSVNFSGPSYNSVMRGWDVQSTMNIQG